MVAAAAIRMRTAAVLRSMKGRPETADIRCAPSEQVFERYEPNYDGDEEPGHDRAGMTVQHTFDGGAEAPEQGGQHEESRAAGHQGQDHEPEQVVTGKARGDGDELVGNRGQSFDED